MTLNDLDDSVTRSILFSVWFREVGLHSSWLRLLVNCCTLS